MIQDIDPEVFHNEYAPLRPEDGDTVLQFLINKSVLIGDGEEEICFPTVKELFDDRRDELRYLFSISGRHFFLASEKELEAPEGWHYEKLMYVNKREPAPLRFAAGTGYHLFNWYRRNVFCGCCGKKMEPDAKMRALRCPGCGDMVFPRLDPAVIVGVVDTERNKILVTRYNGRDYKGVALIAGFCEIGETVETTVRREVMEEAGITVGRLKYYKSQPWGQDSNLLLGVFAEADSTLSIHMDTEELSSAGWASPKDLEGKYAGNVSLTGDMMRYFCEYGSPF